MANRIYIDSNGMKISLPGIDVLTATDEQLSFDSNWSWPPIVASGVVRVSSANGHTFTYSRTYVGSPLVLCAIVPVNDTSYALCVVGESKALNGNVGWYNFVVGNTQFSFSNQSSPDVFVHYRVFDLDLV